jgi:hypothetical protein
LVELWAWIAVLLLQAPPVANNTLGNHNQKKVLSFKNDPLASALGQRMAKMQRSDADHKLDTEQKQSHTACGDFRPFLCLRSCKGSNAARLLVSRLVFVNPSDLGKMACEMGC